jgi:small subunit ribosomal protein S9
MEWHRNNILSPVVISENDGKYDVKVNLAGGGVTGQAEALRLALAKAMVIIDPENKSDLRKAGLVTRDARVVERKKFGKRKARKTAQFSKR